MPDSIGGIEIEITSDPKKADSSAKKTAERWVKSFSDSLNQGLDRTASSSLGKSLFGNRTYNIQNQPTGYQGGILSGAANSVNAGMLLKLGLIAGGIGLVVGFLAKSSPALGKTVGMFESAMKLFFRPFGDMLATLLRPALIWLIKMGILWNQFFGKGPVKDVLSALWGLTPMNLPDTVKKTISVLSDPKFWGDIEKYISDSLSSIGKIVSTAWNDITKYLSGAWDKMRLVAGDVAGHVYNLWTWLSNQADKIWGGVTTWIRDEWSKITGLVTGPLQKIVNFVNSITWPSWMPGATTPTPTPSSSDERVVDSGPFFASAGGVTVTGSAPVYVDSSSGSSPDDIPIAFASGGIVTKPTLGLIAESEPEAVIPLSKLGKNNINISIGDINISTLNKREIYQEIMQAFGAELQRRLYVHG